MATFEIQSAKGEIFTIEAPDNISQEQLLTQLEQAGIAPKQPPQPQKPVSLGQQVRGAAGQAIRQFPGVGAAEALAQAPEAVQRGVLTGGGATVGRIAGGPGGAAAGAAIGGTLADIAQQPEQARQVLQPLGEAALATSPFGGGPETTQKALAAFDALKEINPIEAGKFAKKRAIEAGTAAIFSFAPVLTNLKSVTGPFTATLKNPSLVFSKARQLAFATLNRSKQILRRGESARELGRIDAALTQGGQRLSDLANEATNIVKQGLPASGAQLLGFREALRQMKNLGGPSADRFRRAFGIINKRLEALIPGLGKQFSKASEAMSALAKQSPSAFIPIGGRGVQVAQAAGAIPGVRRLAGAAMRGIVEAAPGVAGGTVGALESLLGSQ